MYVWALDTLDISNSFALFEIEFKLSKKFCY